MENPHTPLDDQPVPAAESAAPPETAPVRDSAPYSSSGTGGNQLPLFGTGLGYRWQGFLVYFFMWLYGIVIALNGIPFFTGALREDIRQDLPVLYLPYLDATVIGTGAALVLLGAAIIAARFLLARYKRCALPVFFTVSVVDLLAPLASPLVAYAALYPFSKLLPLGDLYRLCFSEFMHGTILQPTFIRVVLLAFHSWYYFRRRTDFRN